jgi:hypothetical protein
LAEEFGLKWTLLKVVCGITRIGTKLLAVDGAAHVELDALNQRGAEVVVPSVPHNNTTTTTTTTTQQQQQQHTPD